jgi:hypothetical protein
MLQLCTSSFFHLLDGIRSRLETALSKKDFATPSVLVHVARGLLLSSYSISNYFCHLVMKSCFGYDKLGLWPVVLILAGPGHAVLLLSALDTKYILPP